MNVTMGLQWSHRYIVNKHFNTLIQKILIIAVISHLQQHCDRKNG